MGAVSLLEQTFIVEGWKEKWPNRSVFALEFEVAIDRLRILKFGKGASNPLECGRCKQCSGKCENYKITVCSIVLYKRPGKIVVQSGRLGCLRKRCCDPAVVSLLVQTLERITDGSGTDHDYRAL